MDPREKRLAQNEALYREINERVQAIATSHPDIGNTPHEYSYFCECSNADCNLQVVLPTAEYEWVRAKPTRFVVATGHDLPDIEHVVREGPGFLVIEKEGEAGEYVAHLDPRGRDSGGPPSSAS
jgi:hypothetical protein